MLLTYFVVLEKMVKVLFLAMMLLAASDRKLTVYKAQAHNWVLQFWTTNLLVITIWLNNYQVLNKKSKTQQKISSTQLLSATFTLVMVSS